MSELSFETIRSAFAGQSLFEDKTWQLSPSAWPLTPAQVTELEQIGAACLEFHQALETLYLRSAQGKNLLRNKPLLAPWVADYLDRGKSDIQVDIRGTGPSMRAVMASLNGSTTIVVGEGTIDSRVFDIAGADLTKILAPLSGGGSSGRSTLNCVVNRMDIKDGVANTRVLLTDTNTLSVVGEGAINLGTEQLGMMLRPKAKGASVSDDMIRQKMAELVTVAREQVLNEG